MRDNPNRRLRVLRILSVSALLTILTAGLGGCETANDVKQGVVDAAHYVGDKVAGRSATTDDGTACYANERTAFYQAVDAVEEANRTALGAKVLATTGTVASTYFQSTISKQLAQGFTAAMTQVQSDIEADRSRIVTVTTSFNRLMECRRREARKTQSDYRAGKLTRDVAVAKVATLNKLNVDDVAAASRVNAILRQRNEAFALSTERIQRDAPPAANRDETSQRKREVAKATQGVQTNQRALDQQEASVQQAERLKDQSFDLSLRFPESPARST